MNWDRRQKEEGLSAPWAAGIDEFLLYYNTGIEWNQNQNKEPPLPSVLCKRDQREYKDRYRQKKNPIGPLHSSVTPPSKLVVALNEAPVCQFLLARVAHKFSRNKEAVSCLELRMGRSFQGHHQIDLVADKGA